MGMSKNGGKIKWYKDTATTWRSSAERGVTATITFTAPGTYTLLLDDVGPTTAAYATLGLAKNAFRKYLLDKST